MVQLAQSYLAGDTDGTLKGGSYSEVTAARMIEHK
jgi:hypothetical protein